MSKRSSKKSKRRSKAVPVLGITGLSLSLASGATASTGEATTTVQQPHELFLGEEEIFDTSLSTFYTFDRENGEQAPLGQMLKLARGCGGGGCGCGGRGGGCGCGGGHGGCGCGGAARGCAGGVHVGCAGGARGFGCRCAGVGVRCAGVGVRCAGIGVRCAGFGVHCRCAFFRRCFGCGCGGCGGCGGWGCGTCWIWTPGWGWINTCWSESTPAGEEASVATDASSYAPPSPPSSPSSSHRNEETFTVPSESGGTREIKIINRP